jgi:glucosyl-dolichyl phosphate glucuronosyltransferase
MIIDVMICTYNRGAMLKKAMESILHATIPPNYSLRLIIVNNNSQDDTEQIVNSFMNKAEIVYVREKRQGKSYALNTGLGLIQGDIVLFTDDDITVDDNWFLEIAHAIEQYSNYECFGMRVIGIYPEQLPDWLDITGRMTFLRTALLVRESKDQDAEYQEGKTPGGVNMFFRRKAVEENGPFRTDLGPKGKKLGFSEDVEYCSRFLDRNKKFMYVSRAVVYHPVHPERLKKSYLLKWQFFCGRSEVSRTRGIQGIPMFKGIPRYLLRQIAEHAVGWTFSLNEKDRFFHRLRLYYATGEFVEYAALRFRHSPAVSFDSQSPEKSQTTMSLGKSRSIAKEQK